MSTEGEPCWASQLKVDMNFGLTMNNTELPAPVPMASECTTTAAISSTKDLQKIMSLLFTPRVFQYILYMCFFNNTGIAILC